MPTYATTKAFTSSAWAQFNLSQLPNGQAEIILYVKTAGVGVTFSDAQPSYALGSTDPVFYVDIGAVSFFRGNPHKLWIYGAASNQTSIMAKT